MDNNNYTLVGDSLDLYIEWPQSDHYLGIEQRFFPEISPSLIKIFFGRNESSIRCVMPNGGTFKATKLVKQGVEKRTT